MVAGWLLYIVTCHLNEGWLLYIVTCHLDEGWLLYIVTCHQEEGRLLYIITCCYIWYLDEGLVRGYYSNILFYI